MAARELLGILMRAPLEYQVSCQKGSHRRLVAPERPPLTFAFHDGQRLPPGLVKKVLTRDVGLSEEEMLELL